MSARGTFAVPANALTLTCRVTSACHPLRHAGVRNRVEVREIWLDVEHRRAVDSVEAAHAHGVSLDGEQRDGGHEYRVEADLAARGEYPLQRVLGVVARVQPVLRPDRLRRDKVRPEQDVDMRVAFEAEEAVGELRPDQDARLHAAPVEARRLRLLHRISDDANGAQRNPG